MTSELNEKLITYLRQHVTSLEPSDTARVQAIDLLSELYTVSKYYPCDPMLHAWEVSRVGGTPFGSGGFGDCWKGLLLGHHKVALKCARSHIPDETAMRRVEREMKVWKQLRHPNVLPFIGSVILESPSKCYMVSPWMKNGDLREYLKLYPDVDYVSLLAQIAAGLEYLHTSNPVVVHGDLKAANVLVSEAGEACIADFGLSEMIIESDKYESNGYSSAWKNGGNPRWQAPELFAEYRRTTESDIFAYGRVIYEVFTGKFPFVERREHQVYAVVERGELPPRPKDNDAKIRGLTDSMWKFMATCCVTEPQRRPSAQSVAAHLRSVDESRRGVRAFEPMFHSQSTQTLEPTPDRLTKVSVNTLDVSPDQIHERHTRSRDPSPFGFPDPESTSISLRQPPPEKQAKYPRLISFLRRRSDKTKTRLEPPPEAYLGVYPEIYPETYPGDHVPINPTWFGPSQRAETPGQSYTRFSNTTDDDLPFVN